MEGKIMKAKRWMVLAIGAMLVMNVSAREVRRGHGGKRPIRMEHQFVRCERCGKVIELRREPRFMAFREAEFRRGEFRGPAFRNCEFRKGEFKKREFRKGEVRKGEFRKGELKKHHRHGRR